MYAQRTTIRVPLNHMNQMRLIIEEDYFPKLSARPGFVSAMLLEQADDPECAEVIVLWDDQAAVERFASTGSLEASVQSLAAYLPGVQARRESYVITVAAEKDRQAPQAAYTYAAPTPQGAKITG